jgi:ketosteroid isomerase-like protein
MPSCLVVLAMVVAMIDPLPLQAQPKTNMELDRVTSALMAAFNAEDAARAALLYAEDAVLMPANMPMIKGRAAIQAHFQKEFASADMTLRLDPIESTIEGNHGFGFGTSTFTLKRDGASPSVTSAPTVDKGKYVLVFRRVGTDWKILYDIFNNDAPSPQAK